MENIGNLIQVRAQGNVLICAIARAACSVLHAIPTIPRPAGQDSLFRKLELLLLMDKILHDPKEPKLWEFSYIPYDG